MSQDLHVGSRDQEATVLDRELLSLSDSEVGDGCSTQVDLGHSSDHQLSDPFEGVVGLEILGEPRATLSRVEEISEEPTHLFNVVLLTVPQGIIERHLLKDLSIVGVGEGLTLQAVLPDGSEDASLVSVGRPQGDRVDTQFLTDDRRHPGINDLVSQGVLKILQVGHICLSVHLDTDVLDI